MKRNGLDWLKICLIFGGIGAAGFLYVLFTSGIDRTRFASVEGFMDGITVFIAIVALYFSLITFFSIDAVDKKNRMDKNVLEISSYNPSYPRMIKELNVATSGEYHKKLTDMVVKKPKIRTCMQFADWIQNIIDHIIWFAYYEWEPEVKKKFLNNLNRQYKKYDEVGSGIKLLLSENIKLIEQVFTYQENRKKDIYTLSNLENVRYTLIPNPIAQIVYYDYLGLDYRKNAAAMMIEGCPCKEFTKEYFEIRKKCRPDIETDRCRYYIQKATESFLKATERSEDDILWRGYLEYNLVRCEIMMFLLSEDTERDQMYPTITAHLEECVKIRTNICYMINQDGYLKSQFEAEKVRAAALQSAFLAVFQGKS